MVLPTLSTGFLFLIPVPVLPESQALIYVSPFARNTLLTLLSLCNSYSSFKAHLCVTILGKISHCVICVSTYCVCIFIPGFICNLGINMCSQVCLLPTLVCAQTWGQRQWLAMQWDEILRFDGMHQLQSIDCNCLACCPEMGCFSGLNPRESWIHWLCLPWVRNEKYWH